MDLDAEALLFGRGHAAPFLAAHWAKRWSHQRAATRLGELFSLDELAAHAFSPLAPGRGGDVLHLRAGTVDGEGRGTMFGAPLEMARQLLDLGLTLAFDGLQATHPKLTALARSVGRLVGHVGDVSINCFLSPDGSGLPWHIDITHGFILQVSGEKRWQLGPQIAAPPIALQRDSAGSAQTENLLQQLRFTYPKPGDDAAEILMQPDDVLYLPPGQWHRASAKGTSTHLSVIIKPFTFSRLLRAMLVATALQRTDWRQDLQQLGVADPSGPAAPPTSRPELLQYLAARLDEARRDLAAMTPERLALTMQTLESSSLLRDVLYARASEIL